jgi:hypothetical protein
MFKKTITYTDFNDQEQTKTLYFNLSKAEVIEMEVGEAGGYGKMLKSVIDSKDAATIMKVFKQLILKSYGIKTPDGQGFTKSKELTEEFENSAAYSELFVELCTDAKAASEFVSRILPLTEEQRREVLDKQAKTTELPSNV